MNAKFETQILNNFLSTSSHLGQATDHQLNIACVCIPLSICTWILKFLIWKIEFDKLDFLSSSNLISAGYTVSKNQVQTRQKKTCLSNSIFQTGDVKNQVQINRGGVCMWSLHRIWPNCSFNCNYPRKPWMSNSALCTLGHKIYWIKWNFNELFGWFIVWTRFCISHVLEFYRLQLPV